MNSIQYTLSRANKGHSEEFSLKLMGGIYQFYATATKDKNWGEKSTKCLPTKKFPNNALRNTQSIRVNFIISTVQFNSFTILETANILLICLFQLHKTCTIPFSSSGRKF